MRLISGKEKESSISQLNNNINNKNWWPRGYDVPVQWEKMRNSEPDGHESNAMVQLRMAKLQGMLKELVSDETSLLVIIVCHSDVISWLTRPQPSAAKEGDMDGDYSSLEGIWTENCQILDITDYILK